MSQLGPNAEPQAEGGSFRSYFTLRELLVTVAIIGALLGIALPGIQAARENSRLDRCRNNLHEIGIALLNYADMRKVFPPVSTNSDSTPDIPGDPSPTTTSPVSYDSTGAAASQGAGYSWIVMILPEVDVTDLVPLFQNISINSNKFSLPAFSPRIINGAPGSSAPHASTVQLERFRCPSCAGGPVVDVSPRMTGVSGGALETGSAISNYVGGIATGSGSTGIAITNYNAILGTHVDPHSKSASNPNNGAMRFRPIDGRAFDIGMKLASITDGLSRTPIVAETRERRFSSWYDGTMNWVVAARHSNPDGGTVAIFPAMQNPPPVIQGQPLRDRWVIGTDGSSLTGGTALNYGPTAEHPTAVYLPTGSLSDPDISAIPPGRLWGPSSQHKGGLVNHVFGDAHVESISDGIDPNVYLWIVTRAGGEPLPAP